MFPPWEIVQFLSALLFVDLVQVIFFFTTQNIEANVFHSIQDSGHITRIYVETGTQYIIVVHSRCRLYCKWNHLEALSISK